MFQLSSPDAAAGVKTIQIWKTLIKLMEFSSQLSGHTYDISDLSEFDILQCSGIEQYCCCRGIGKMVICDSDWKWWIAIWIENGDLWFGFGLEMVICDSDWKWWLRLLQSLKAPPFLTLVVPPVSQKRRNVKQPSSWTDKWLPELSLFLVTNV